MTENTVWSLLKPFTGQHRCLTGTGFQFQKLTGGAASLMQCLMNLPDDGEDVRQFPLNVGIRGMDL